MSLTYDNNDYLQFLNTTKTTVSEISDTSNQFWTWGESDNGQLGLGTSSVVSTPTQVGTSDSWRFVLATNALSSYALTDDNTLFSWGNGEVEL